MLMKELAATVVELLPSEELDGSALFALIMISAKSATSKEFIVNISLSRSRSLKILGKVVAEDLVREMVKKFTGELLVMDVEPIQFVEFAANAAFAPTTISVRIA
jgi:hypothetical protein